MALWLAVCLSIVARASVRHGILSDEYAQASTRSEGISIVDEF